VDCDAENGIALKAINANSTSRIIIAETDRFRFT
jgi:hypothetical protein